MEAQPVQSPEQSIALKRILGPVTAFLLSLGVAIGSGIFRTPSIVIAELHNPLVAVLAWCAGGLFVLATGLVTAELATRFPSAGGEYVYLREAYGEFVAFFFGWSFTVFIIGGGAATIAAAFGEALAELLAAPMSRAPVFAAGAVIGVTAVNAFGLRAGAGFQNVLTALKILALLTVAALAFLLGDQPTDWTRSWGPSEGTVLGAVIAGGLPVLWAYSGTTDTAKMAEEIKDVHRGLPKALVAAALSITVLYVLVNVSFFFVLTPAEAAQSRFVPNAVVSKLFGMGGAKLMTAVSMVVFLGALSSTVLATVRVTFALARDGLSFAVLARVSKSQAPVAALILGGAVATVFALNRSFQEILRIYFLASAILFGLTYASLLVFRARDRARGGMPPDVFRCPAGPVLAVLLIATQVFMAVCIVAESPDDSIYTLGLLGLLAVFYLVWKRFTRPAPSSKAGPS